MKNFIMINVFGSLAQMVEHWSNKPRVMGSIPIGTILLLIDQDDLAEWLRRWPAKPLCFAREGSNPSVVVIIFTPR